MVLCGNSNGVRIRPLEIKVVASSSSGNCYIISSAIGSIMLDCGLSVSQIKRGCGYKTHEIKACLISHEH